MKKWGWPWARGAPRNFGVPCNISAAAWASDFKFGTQLGFANAHHKMTPRWKSGRAPELDDLPKILGFPFNISAAVGASDFKFSKQLGIGKAHHKNHNQRKKWAWLWTRVVPNIWSSPLIFLQRPRCPLSVSGASCFQWAVVSSEVDGFHCLLPVWQSGYLVQQLKNVRFDTEQRIVCFYNAAALLAMQSAVIAMANPSVCLSVTRWFKIQTNEDRIMRSSLSGS